ncbi:hypothetical protein HS041_12035 [Planomonospora sp. ID67723]|uniref:hypothetical protein n=1 Tax=Planomonospora sp. ID67723 TaxID=2738134 RepID=UPI0018C383B3|nr:hypothetical protein [Planomonospora sp. ID67723]MBG0828497.1 hypothetical protein [Planomonospora sp. ID67723]
MTGPDHYRAAEEMLATAKEADAGADRDDIKLFLRFAEIHATLALAAATGVGAIAGDRQNWDGMPTPDARAWLDVAGSAASEEAGQ